MASKTFRTLLGIILLTCLTQCSGSPGEGLVNLPVPFAGALTSDSRVIAVDGAVLNGDFASATLSVKSQQIGQATFSAFDSLGNNVGQCEFVEEAMSAPSVQGIETLFTMPICCHIDEFDEVCADTTQFDELPYTDTTIDICALLPENERTQGVENCGARLVRGAASGVMTSGTGSYAVPASLDFTIEHRYVAAVKGEGLDRRALSQLDGVFILHR